MTIAVTSPVVGLTTHTGLTNPTYTIVADQAPDVNGRAYAVSVLGGTQSGVEVSAASNPFTLLFTRPKSIRTLPALNSNGQLGNVPRNTWTVSLKKGVDVLAGQPKQVMLARLDIAVPAGADIADPESVRAGLAMFLAALAESADDIANSIIQGVL
jgi:hypothetical protein